MNQELNQTQNHEQGQTLIETMVAVFIMVMGITAALGLAIYTFNATSLVNKQIVGMGLAREGIEAVKNMRDTNWLKSATFSTTCNCYTNWETAYYNIDPPTTGTYTLDLSSGTWQFAAQNSNFRLSFDSTASSFPGHFYFSSIYGGTASDYYRRITLDEVTTSPYDSTSPRLQVTSDVWWNDRKCPSAATYEASVTACRVRLVTYLTNWKNY